MRRRTVKVTFWCIWRAFWKLETVSRRNGESRTDAVNRAIQLYAVLDQTIRRGDTVLIRRPDGARAELHIDGSDQ